MIQTNPFFVLNVGCTANRRESAIAAEEMDFVAGTEACAEAQRALTNPIKRLAAEIDWFPETSAEMISLIRSCIEHNEMIPTSMLAGISKLNGMLYNLSVSNEKSVIKVCATVKAISAQYESVTAENIIDLLNVIHSKAGIGTLTVADVEHELVRKRDSIRQAVTGYLQALGKESYVECVTQLAKDSVDGEIDVVITDVFDQYELWTKARIEDKQSLIDAKIDSLKQNTDSDAHINDLVSDLLQVVYEWNQLTYPVQAIVSQTGVDRLRIGATALKLRGLVLYLHNEKGKTDAAATLARGLQKMFTNLPNVITLLDKDVRVLGELQEKNRKLEQQERENRQADRVYAVDIQGNRFVVPPLCTCCLKPTDSKEKISYSSQMQRGRTTTTRTISVDMPICNECLRHRSMFIESLVWMGLWSLLLGALVMIVALVGFGVDDFTAACIGCGVAVVLFFLIAAMKKTKPLSERHSTRLQSVSIFSLLFSEGDRRGSSREDGSSSTTYTFTNWKYAMLFQEANAGIASPVRIIPKTNSAKQTSVLQIIEHKFTTALKIVGLFALCAFLISLANSSGTFNNLHLDTLLKNAGVHISAPADPTPKATAMPTAKPTTVPSANVPAAAKYTALSYVGSYVYIDITSIEPSIGIGTVKGTNTDIVCECKSPSGESLWVIMPIGDYTKYFDSTAKLTNSATASYKAIHYSNASRVYGHVRNADSMCAGLSEDISTTKIIEFDSIDQQVGRGSNSATDAIVTAAPAKVAVTNGKMFITPSYKCVCPFTIISSSSTDYYVYLKYQKAPASTTENRTTETGSRLPYESDVAFYVKAGQQVEIDVPIGVYKLYYATGSDFYGTKLLFGEDTHYYASDDLLTFYSDTQYYNGHTITLKATYNGNFDTDPIPETQFPIR